MVKHRVFVILILTSTLFFSCGSNPNVPRHGNWDFALQKVWEIDRIGDELLARPGEPRVGEDGTLYFHDFINKLSYIVDRDGRFVGTFGKKGDAEGEVSWYINCFTTENGVVIGAPDKLHFYTRTGEFIKAAPNDLFARFPLTFINENEFLVAPGALPDAPNGQAVITYVNLTAGEEKIFDELPLTANETAGTGGGVVVGLTPQLKMGYNPDAGRLYYGKNNEYAIYIADLDGNRLKTFGLEREKVRITDDDKRAHFEYHNIPQERIDAIIGRLPNELAYYHRIQVNDGYVFVFAVNSLGPRITRQQIDVFSLDGVYLYRGELRFPGNLHIYGNTENLQIRDNFLYAVLEDEAGRKTIVKYRMALPERGNGAPE
jgi:hypothetical protein